MRLSIILLLISFSAHSNVCETTGQFEAPNCLANYAQEDLGFLLTTAEETKSFCQEECHNKLKAGAGLNLNELKIEQSKMVLNEVQKEITNITMDLMKLRSGIEISGSAAGAIKGCKLERIQENIPACLRGSVDTQVKEIQQKLVNELATVLSGKDSENGLMTRQKNTELDKNSCEASEKNLLLSFLLYSSEEGLDEELLKDKNNLSRLQQNPLINTILNSEELLKEFRAISDPSEKKKFLFGPKVGESYFNSLTKTCDVLIQNAQTALKQLDCNNNKTVYAAKDIEKYNRYQDIKLEKLKENEAQLHLDKMCASINARLESKDIKDLLDKIQTSKRGSALSVSDFKSYAYQENLMSHQEDIIKARKMNPLNPESREAKLLAMCESLVKDENYVELAKGSNENINQILRSMIGSARPTSVESVKILTQEGILTDPKNEVQPVKATSVARYNETISTPAKTKVSTARMQTTQPTANQAAQARHPNEVQHFASNAPEVAHLSQNQEYAVDAQTDNEVKALASRLDKLTDNQKNLLNEYANRNKADQVRSQTVAKPLQPSLAQNTNKRIQSSGHQQPNTVALNEFTPQPTAQLAEQKDTRDRNYALNQANEAREAQSARALNNSDVGTDPNARFPASVEVSKSAKGSKVVDIQVPEQSLVMVDKFKNELRDILKLKEADLLILKDEESIVVKINQYEVRVVFDKTLGQYRAECLDKSFPKDYENVIKEYFNRRIKISDLRDALPS